MNTAAVTSLSPVVLTEKFSSSSCKEQASEEHERKAGIISGNSLLQNNISALGKREHALRIVGLDLNVSGL